MKKTKLKKRMMQVLFVLTLTAAVLVYMFFGGDNGIGHKGKDVIPSNEHMDINTYFGVKAGDDKVIVFLNRKKIEAEAIVQDGRAYLSYSTVEEYISGDFYRDTSTNQLVFTTATDTYKYNFDSNRYMLNSESKLMDYPVVINGDEDICLEMEFLKEHADVQYTFYENPNRLMLVNEWTDIEYVSVIEEAPIRKFGAYDSPILIDAKIGESYIYLSKEGNWTCVQNEEGVKGYIETKCLGEKNIKTLESTYTEPVYPNISRDYKINLVWHQITNKTANSNITKALEKVTGVNVISPTWFKMSDNDGNIVSLASQAYVDEAHSRGLEVWALLENMTYSETISTYKILSNMESRENLVRQVISEVLKYGIDGINVDIESISSGTGEAYIQFIRELSVECRKNGIVLSVDNYVPTVSSYHYHRREQGKIVDYVIIMGYDEHYYGSSKSGSVASIGWVEAGIVNTLKSVPAEKVINAMPFYTRIWKQTPESAAEDKSAGVLVEDPNSKYGRYLLTCQDVSMSYAEKQLEENGVTPKWDKSVGQYYGEYDKDGCTYQIWLEEEDSIAEKMKLIGKYELAGVAGWKLSLPKNSIWEVISSYLN